MARRGMRVREKDNDDIDYVTELRKLLEKNPSPAVHESLGAILYFLDDEESQKEAVEHLTVAAEAGLDKGLYYLGDAYFHGRGIEKDVAKGMDLFMDAALAGSADGAFSIGNEYFAGVNVPYDHPKAFEFLNMAADRGSERAMNTLALMYMGGFYVERDIAKAKKLLIKARARGNLNAVENLGAIEENGPDADYMQIILDSDGIKNYVKGKDIAPQ